MNKVLLDSDAVIALVKEDDASHEPAVKLFKKYKEIEIFIADTTLSESVTTLGRRVSRETSYLCLDFLRQSSFIIVFIDEKIIESAEQYYRQQTSVKNTFVDCINMAVAKAYHLDAIFSFDKGYSQNGFKLLK